MKKVLIKILGIVISIVLIMQSSNVLALTEKEELENEKSKIDDQLEDAMKKQKELESKKSQTMKDVESLIGQISSYESEISLLESKINDLQAKIKAKERDIQQKEEEYNEQEELLDARLIAIYESGNTSYLDVLLTSSSITDFLSKYYSAAELIECDKELIRSIKEQKADIQKQKEELEANKQELDTSLAQTKQKNVQLNTAKKQKEEYAKQLTDEEKELEKEIEELEAANKKIQEEIRLAEIKYQKELEELKKMAGANEPAGSGYFIRPVSGGYISATAYYASSGKFHGAVDYAISTGTVVKAAADGVVMTTANLSGSYGTYVVIRHANGLQSYYAHGTYGSITVKPGQIVKQGEKIMLSGNTGNSKGPHLHFEVRKSPYNYSYSATAYGQDSRVNPLNYL